MSLYEEINNYTPINEQEAADRVQMLKFIKNNPDNFLLRDNRIGHFTSSIWVINKEHTKVLMIYHNIYDSWAWVGGHADGIEDLKEVAMRELWEETGVKNAKLVSPDIFSLETVVVNGHEKKGKYVPSHLHFNITYLAEADENETLVVNEEENQGVKWFLFDEALEASSEKWMIERIYKKLIEHKKGILY